MEKVLAMLAKDRNYIERLADYLTSKKEFGFSVVTFGESAQYKAYEQGHNIDMLLCDEETVLSSASEYLAKNICVLSDYTFINEQVKYPVIFKYQSARTIMEEIIRYYREAEKDSITDWNTAGNKKIICVSSSIGGIYKSTFALALASYYSKTERCLFISFDPFFTFPQEQKVQNEKNLTDIIYFTSQSSPELSSFIISSAKKIDRLEYISGVSHWYDLCDLKPAHIKKMTDSLREADYYDRVIIDAGIMGIATLELLQGADTVIIPIKEKSLRDSMKYDEWKRQIAFISGNISENKTRHIEIPFDENLSNSDFDLRTLLEGSLGKFISEMEGVV